MFLAFPIYLLIPINWLYKNSITTVDAMGGLARLVSFLEKHSKKALATLPFHFVVRKRNDLVTSKG